MANNITQPKNLTRSKDFTFIYSDAIEMNFTRVMSMKAHIAFSIHSLQIAAHLLRYRVNQISTRSYNGNCNSLVSDFTLSCKAIIF